MASVRPVIFDIDGTLLLSGPVVREVFAQAFADICDEAAPLWGVHFAGMTDRGILRLLLEKLGRGDEFDRLFPAFAEHFPELLGQRYPGASGPYLLPGVQDLLDALKRRREVVLLLGSGNLRRTAHIKLDRFGLLPYFVAGAFGSEHERRDAIFQDALDQSRSDLGWDGETTKAWIIGDTESDVESAHKVGARVLAVATGPSKEESLENADALVPDLSDTVRVLQILGVET